MNLLLQVMEPVSDRDGCKPEALTPDIMVFNYWNALPPQSLKSLKEYIIGIFGELWI